MSVLSDGARQMGMELSTAQLAQLDQLQAALLDWNKRFNLTSIKDPAQVETRHFLDSLTAAIPLLPRLLAGEKPRLIDLGTGAGFPGLPLKIAFPSVPMTLVDSTTKKTTFIKHVVEMLQLSDVTVLAERAETLGSNPDHRERYQWATGRALGPLPVVIELCAPFLEPGGLMVAQRRGDLEAEILKSAPAYSKLKMWSRAPIDINLPGLEDGRGLVIGEKYGPTPSVFPRRTGMAKKEPLA